MAALQFPEHFPPKTAWKRFFIGVRWLGPDLSFFAAMKAEQGQRTSEDLRAWVAGPERELAVAIGTVLSRELGWKVNVFLPEDSVAAAFRGPSFDHSDPELAVAALVEMLPLEFGIQVAPEFFAKRWTGALRQLVNDLLAERGGTPCE